MSERINGALPWPPPAFPSLGRRIFVHPPTPAELRARLAAKRVERAQVQARIETLTAELVRRLPGPDGDRHVAS